ncbi:type II toxin-antitoxin system Phd/YefM family antitoxin [Aliarcobacter butzleri]|uniref:type II toxin-antitoxin system Phd/YefM family antitoxin n=1 Tax=Aliarcobacter butzleri TaxID=28197 RepID=UPI0021B60FC4|nr:type II toxin-antitoxin system Phd/YefM family antitoxin [Aliarcobacter butzleri]MCT7606787.1 type II toxin-antitoxin system Phd/YefM family antitoxin [Aliarcobacter butzleri]
MQVVSMTEARNNFKAIFDAVFHNNEEIIIHRKGRENVVVVPFEEYDILKKAFNHDYMSWHKKELENIGKIGLDSKSFIEDNEDYSKW